MGGVEGAEQWPALRSPQILKEVLVGCLGCQAVRGHLRSGRDTNAGFQSPGKRKIIGWED